MTKYPHEAGEVSHYTPASLANLDAAPVFRIRPATERDRRTVRSLIISERLRDYTVQEFRTETLNGLRELWSEDVYAQNEGRLLAYWDALDQYESMEGEKEPFSHPDEKAMDELSARITEAWPPLGRMAAKSADFHETYPKLCASVVILGWSGLDAKYAREEGITTLESLEGAAFALADIERKAIADKVDGIIGPGVAFIELITRAISTFSLNRGEEKNSESPSPSPETLSTSETDGQDKEAGRSTAKSSKKTRAA